MSQGFQKPGFGVWPPGMPAFQKTDSTLTLYLDPVGGDDDKVGTSRVNAVRTPARISDLVALYPGNVDVHMRSGAAVLPSRGWFLLPRMFGGLVRFLADEAWDPSVYTVIGGDRTSEAATTDSVIKASGLVVDALQDLSVRFTTGAAAGQYRRIRDNTVTDITPSTAFDPAPGVGDTYQVFTSNAYFALPALPDGETDVVTNYVFCADSPGIAPPPFDWSGFGYLTISRPLGILFDGVGLRGGTGFWRHYFGATTVYFFGTDANTDFQDSSDPCGAAGGTLYSGYGLPDYQLKQGWGFAGSGGPNCQTIESMIGCWHIGDFWWLPTHGRFFGGRFEDVVTAGGATGFFDGDWVTGLIAPLFGSAGNFCLQLNGPNSVVELNRGIVRGLFQILYGMQVHMNANVTGAPNGLTVQWGGHLMMEGGAPQVGGAGNDWQVGFLAAFNKSFFAGANTVKFGTDGSCAQRVF